jgi:hypothetical protein
MCDHKNPEKGPYVPSWERTGTNNIYIELIDITNISD